jgi:hypothetical protein
MSASSGMEVYDAVVDEVLPQQTIRGQMCTRDGLCDIHLRILFRDELFVLFGYRAIQECLEQILAKTPRTQRRTHLKIKNLIKTQEKYASGSVYLLFNHPESGLLQLVSIGYLVFCLLASKSEFFLSKDSEKGVMLHVGDVMCLLSSVFFSHEQRLFSEPDKPAVEAKIKAMAARAATRYTCGTKDILGMAQRLVE